MRIPMSFITAAALAASGSAWSQQSLPPDSPLVHEPAALLLLADTPDKALGDGCWVRFYDGTDFTGASATLVGPGQSPDMAAAAPHWRAWDSAIVGPRASVTVFDGRDFRQRSATLAPGANVTDLGQERLARLDEVRSARLAC